MSISATIKSVQDIMRQDAGVDGDAQRISQLVWMLFLKVFDSKEKEWDAFLITTYILYLTVCVGLIGLKMMRVSPVMSYLIL